MTDCPVIGTDVTTIEKIHLKIKFDLYILLLCICTFLEKKFCKL